MLVRDEHPGDEDAIRRITAAAFENHPHGNGREPELVDALRQAGALTLSLVAEVEGEIRGHAAFTAVSINGRDMGWYGLGPVSVEPGWQRRGLGSTMIEAGLTRLRSMGAQGCVVVGEPAYYGRFGFAADPGLKLEGLPPEYFMALAFGAIVPSGSVGYHPLFFSIV